MYIQVTIIKIQTSEILSESGSAWKIFTFCDCNIALINLTCVSI